MESQNGAGLGCDGASDNVFRQPLPRLDEDLAQALAMQPGLQPAGHDGLAADLTANRPAQNALSYASHILNRASQGSELHARPSQSGSTTQPPLQDTFPATRSLRGLPSAVEAGGRSAMLGGLRERFSTAPANVFRPPFVPPRSQLMSLQISDNPLGLRIRQHTVVETTVYRAFMELPSHVASMLRESLRSSGIVIQPSGDLRMGPRETDPVLGFRGAQTYLIQGGLAITMLRPVALPVLNRRCPHTGNVSGDGTYRPPAAQLVHEQEGHEFVKSAEYAIIHSERPPPWHYIFSHRVPEDSGLGVHMRSLGREAGSWYIVPRTEMV